MFDVMEKAYKFANIFAKSDIVPAHYRGKPENTFIAVQTAYRMNLDPMLIMQNTYVVKGKLGMNSAFAISLANSSGIFEGGIRYKLEGKNEQLKVTATARVKVTGEEISYTIAMSEAIAEGWTENKKYKTLPELMLRYRAAIFLIRTHVPEVLNGMHMVEEIEDMHIREESSLRILSQNDASKSYYEPKEEAEEPLEDSKKQNIFKRFEAIGVSKEKIFNYYGKSSIDQFNQEDMKGLLAVGTSIKDGYLTAGEAFETKATKLAEYLSSQE